MATWNTTDRIEAAEVVDRLGPDDAELRALVDQLDTVPEPARAPQPVTDREVLRRLGVPDEFTEELAATAPGPDTEPALGWLFRRLVARLLQDMGSADPPWRPWPTPSQAWGPTGRWLAAHALLATLDETRGWHRAHGVPDEVSWATLGELGRQVRRHREFHACGGLQDPFWVAMAFGGQLFDIGRLQYNPIHLRVGIAGPLFWYDDAAAVRLGVGFRPGDAALGLHIPATGPLLPDQVDASLAAAREFFGHHFPDETRRVVVCTSWLLDDQLADHLPEASNIVAFQRRFTLVDGFLEADFDIMGHVFQRADHPEHHTLPQTTALERAAVAHWAAGGHWRLRTGWLPL